LGDGVALLKPRVRSWQRGSWQQPRQERLVGGVVEDREQPESSHQANEHDDGQGLREGEQRHGAEHKGACQVGADQQRLAAHPVRQDTDEQTHHEVGRPPRCVDPADVSGRAVQVDHHEDPDGQSGDVGTKG